MSQDVVLEAAMVSWLEELDRREVAAREEIAELREQIEELPRRHAEQDEVLSRLQITRETMTKILSGEETVSVAGAVADADEAGMEEHRLPAGSRVRLVPQWTPELAMGVLPGGTGTSSRSSRTRCIRCRRITCVPRWVCRRTRARRKAAEEEPGLFTPREGLAAGGDAPEQAGSSAMRRRAGVGSGSRA
ncbi:hypothetical protein ACWDCB_44720 [Streptomyces sp. NPDC001178]